MKDGITFSIDPEEVDLAFLSGEISRTYWGENRTSDKLKRIIRNCFVISMFNGSEQIAFGRVVTDYETHAYIMDVIVKESERGKGYGKRIMKEIIENSAFGKLESFTLKTKDAGDFYKELGFKLKIVDQYCLVKEE